MLVFDDAVVDVVLEEQRSFDDDDEIDVQQLQTQPITQYNQHQSLSLSFVLRLTHGHRSQEGNVALLPLALRARERECNVATHDSITIT